jgi:hypothetical protein
MKKYFIALILLVSGVSSSHSQSTFYGAGIGQGLYWGDLNSPDFLTAIKSNNGFAFQAFVRHHLNYHFAIKGNLLFSRVKGNDASSDLDWQKERNLSFKSPINEFSISAEYYLLKFITDSPGSSWSPYATFGVAGFYFNPKAELNGNEFELQPLGTEGQGLPGFKNKYKRIAGSFLFGGGLAMKIRDKVIIHADVIGRRSTTDFIDDVSGSYVNYDELRVGNGILAATLADRTAEYFGSSEPIQRETGNQRGGKSVRDYYFTGMISFSILLSDGGANSFKNKGKSKIKCPTF